MFLSCQRLSSQAATKLLQQLRLGQRCICAHSQPPQPRNFLSWGGASVQLHTGRLSTVRCLSSVGGQQAIEKKKVVFCGTPEVRQHHQLPVQCPKGQLPWTYNSASCCGASPAGNYLLTHTIVSHLFRLCVGSQVAALVLERLLQAAAQPDATFEVSARVK